MYPLVRNDWRKNSDGVEWIEDPRSTADVPQTYLVRFRSYDPISLGLWFRAEDHIAEHGKQGIFSSCYRTPLFFTARTTVPPAELESALTSAWLAQIPDPPGWPFESDAFEAEFKSYFSSFPIDLEPDPPPLPPPSPEPGTLGIPVFELQSHIAAPNASVGMNESWPPARKESPAFEVGPPGEGRDRWPPNHNVDPSNGPPKQSAPPWMLYTVRAAVVGATIFAGCMCTHALSHVFDKSLVVPVAVGAIKTVVGGVLVFGRHYLGADYARFFWGLLALNAYIIVLATLGELVGWAPDLPNFDSVLDRLLAPTSKFLLRGAVFAAIFTALDGLTMMLEQLYEILSGHKD